MSTPEKDILPPPYTSSPSLLDHLAQTRTHHIHSTIQTQILPHITRRFSAGLATTTIALLPSDTPIPAPRTKSESGFDDSSSTYPTEARQKVDIVGFSSDEAPEVVKLEGPMDGSEFWRSEVVVRELERRLGEEVNAGRYVQAASTESMIEEIPQKQVKSGFFARMAGKGPRVAGAKGNLEVYAKRVDDVAGRAAVKVRLEEICLRTVNEFGLYDTLSRQCVVVRVDAGC
jgi:hypothetical protein